MAYDTWGGSWGNSWATSWTRGSTPPAATSQRGGFSKWTESERRLNERLRRLALQQAFIEDDEEALAILLASIIRR